MYQLTRADREPVELFGKVYFWRVNDKGALSLMSMSSVVGQLRELLGE